MQSTIEIGNTGEAVDNMFYNAKFMDKINSMQEKINVLTEERKNSPQKKTKVRPNSAYPADHPLACEKFPSTGGPVDLDEFRDMMDWVYGPKPSKHKSPTKRLM